tara:strand:- start:404 stop:577 length:174 start_codon:yes stop_codon:yes gene_type:complete
MLTTDGINFSAKSAKDAGVLAEFDEKLTLINNKENIKVLKILYLILFYKVPYYKEAN